MTPGLHFNGLAVLALSERCTMSMIHGAELRLTSIIFQKGQSREWRAPTFRGAVATIAEQLAKDLICSE